MGGKIISGTNGEGGNILNYGGGGIFLARDQYPITIWCLIQEEIVIVG